MTYAEITQDDVDALWLSCRVSITLVGAPRGLRGRSQLRMQRLLEEGQVEYRDGDMVLRDREEINKEKFARASARVQREITSRGKKDERSQTS